MSLFRPSLWLALALMLAPHASPAAEEGYQFEPGREQGSVRALWDASNVRGSQVDTGPGLSYRGWGYETLTLSGGYFGSQFYGFMADAEGSYFSLLNNKTRVTTAHLLRADVGPALRFRLGPVNFEVMVGYQFAQMPTYGNSASPAFVPARHQAVVGAAKVQLALPAGLVAEAQASYPLVLSTAVPGIASGVSSWGYRAGADLLVPVYTSDGVQLRAGVDYQFIYDQTWDNTPLLSSKLWENRFGIELEAVFGTRLRPPLGRLRVHVADPAGKPMAGVALQLSSPQGLPVSLVTGASGDAVGEGLHAGAWSVAASKEGFEPSSGRADVVQDAEAALAITLTPVPPKTGTLGVQVVDATSGKPVPSATVKVGETASHVKEDGKITLEDLNPGVLPVAITAEGYRPGKEVVTVVAGQTTELAAKLVRQEVIQDAILSGVVRSTRGEPVEATLSIPEAKLRTRVAADGTFRFHLKPGIYRIVITATGYITQAKAVELKPGDETIFNVDLHPTRQ